MIPANAIVLRSVKCSDIHKCIAGYGKATLYGVVDLGRKKFAKVFVMSYMGSRVLQEKLCHLKSTCIQAKQLQYNNDIHYVLMIFIFLHIRRFCISKGGSVPLPSDMRGSTVPCNMGVCYLVIFLNLLSPVIFHSFFNSFACFNSLYHSFSHPQGVTCHHATHLPATTSFQAPPRSCLQRYTN